MRVGKWMASVAVLAALVIAVPVFAGQAMTQNEKITTEFYTAVRNNPVLLRGFVAQMPKGADVFSSLSGAMFGEEYLRMAVQVGMCVNADMELVPAKSPGKCPRKAKPVSEAIADGVWPVDTGNLYASVAKENLGDIIATVGNTLAAQQVVYSEQGIALYPAGFSKLAAKDVKWTGLDGVAESRKALLNSKAFTKAVAQANDRLDAAVKRAATKFAPGVSMNFLHTVTGSMKLDQLFAQLVFSAELARQNMHVVGITVTGLESGPAEFGEFGQYMQLVNAVASMPEYAGLPVMISAGNLTLDEATPTEMRFHMRDAVATGGAKRIANGVSVMHEDDPFALLKHLRKQGVAVAVSLYDSERSLGVAGMDHPLPTYLSYGVPTVLGTTRAGLLRSDITSEFVHASSVYQLTYADLKALARNSVEYSFVPGKSLWADLATATRSGACKDSLIGHETGQCAALLESSPKARMQWDLEARFAEFERKVTEEFGK